MKTRTLYLSLILILSQIACALFSLLEKHDPQPDASVPKVSNQPTFQTTLTSTPLTAFIPTKFPGQTQLTPTLEILNPVRTAGASIGLGEDNLPIYNSQPGTPIGINAWTHGCDWLGVAGQVFDGRGEPVDQLVVEAGGTLDGQPIFGLSITGIVSGYGPGGFEIQLRYQLKSSVGTVWVQLKNEFAQPLSPKIFIDTFDNCNQNLILLNFVRADATPGNVIYFPIIP